MREKTWLLPIMLVSAILAACAGAPASADRETKERAAGAELFDMAGHQVAENPRAGSVETAGVKAPLPLGTTSGRAGAPASLPAPAPPATLPEPDLPSTRDAGQKTPFIELSTLAPQAGSYLTHMNVALPIVKAPVTQGSNMPGASSVSGAALQPAGQGPANAASSPQSSRPAQGSTGQTRTAASQTAPAAAPASAPRAASAPAASASQPAQKATASVDSTQTPRIREIYARIGDELEIGLEGSGYVFLGFTDTNKSAGMIFKSKESKNGKTYFKFKAASRGSYELGFLRQDNTSGKSDKEAILVHVVSDEEFATAVSLQAEDPAREESGGDADYLYAQKLIDMGKYPAALQELMKGYTDANSLANDMIASVYFRMREYDAAEKYYRKNLLISGIPSERAVIGLVSIAIQRRDSNGFFRYFKQLLSIRDLVIEDVLLKAARFQLEEGEITVGLELADECVRRYPQGARRDEADVLTAQLLEAESPRRDIQRARDLYRKVLDAFPESAFAALAAERIRYIEQHFYYVR